MIQYLRSFFGLNKSSSTRAVVGTNVSFDPKEITFIKDSNDRLAVLLTLYKKYKGTAHEDKLKLVYEKTKQIHSFLISKKRIYELELFHIQNTEHFISTFNLIVEVHQSHKQSTAAVPEVVPEVTPAQVQVKEPEVQVPVAKAETTNGRNKGELFEIVEKVRQRNKQGSVIYAEEPAPQVPVLTIPEVSINTIAKVVYYKEDTPGKQVPNDISFVSSPQEKEVFQAYIAARLGVKDIYYVGNASINLPNNKGGVVNEMVPVIYWKHYLYALTLHDYRLYPVKINRSRF